MFSRSPTSKSGRAFTIIELLVAATITVVLVGLMLQVTIGALNTWNQTSGTLTSNNQARIALQYLADDLSSIVWRRDTNVWFLATVQDDQTSDAGDAQVPDANWVADTPASPSGNSGNSKPGRGSPGADRSSLNLAPASNDLADYRFGQAGMWLRFFTCPPDSNTGAANASAPVAVGYQFVRMKVRDNSQESRYMLFRSVVSPFDTGGTRSTFGTGYDLASNAANGYNDLASARNGTSGDPDRVRRPNRTYLLANNVVDFGIRFWRREASGNLTLLFPSDGSGNPSNTNLGYAATLRDDTNLVKNTAPLESVANLSGWISAATMRYGYPDFADVFIRVMTEDGARQLEAFEGKLTVRPASVPNDDEYWWQIVTQNSKVYTQRIALKPRVL